MPLLLTVGSCGEATVTVQDLFDADIQQLLEGLSQGEFTSVDLVKAYLARIQEVNGELHAVIEVNPNVIARAEELDKERKDVTKSLGRRLLHGIPIIVKDNIATPSQHMETTSGSYALVGSVPPRDAFVVSRLISEGAIILAKSNLSEWSSFRGADETLASGWSGRGGQCTNPYLKGADPSGSSGGSAVCAAIGLAAGTLGTETDGSIICPSRINNVVGIKPTVGLTSRSGVIPISEHQDTVGPICRSVLDAAILLQAIEGADDNDPYTLPHPRPAPNYLAALKLTALQGARLGVPSSAISKGEWNTKNKWPGTMEAFEKAMKAFKDLGAVIIENIDLPAAESIEKGDLEAFVLDCEFKHCLNKYLSELDAVPTGVRTLTDIIAFNNTHPELEKPEWYEDQSRMEEANECPDYSDPTYQSSLKQNIKNGRFQGIDFAFKKWNLDALIFPSQCEFMLSAAAIAGYPIITVPLGFTLSSNPTAPANPTIMTGPNLPFGLSFAGTALSEKKLIGYAFAFEQRVNVRKTFGGREKVYKEALPTVGISKG